jgi:hypothetical protein
MSSAQNPHHIVPTRASVPLIFSLYAPRRIKVVIRYTDGTVDTQWVQDRTGVTIDKNRQVDTAEVYPQPREPIDWAVSDPPRN